jgi:hypothetical protein
MSYHSQEEAVKAWVPPVADILSYRDNTIVFVFNNRLHVMRLLPIGSRWHVSMVHDGPLIDLIEEDT